VAKSFTANKIIEAIFWLSAGLFIVLLPYTPSVLTTLLKIVPITMLAILVIRATGDWKRIGILAALGFSAGGDIFMESDNFIFGLSSFLIAHICYLVVFCRNIEFNRLRVLLAIIIASSTLIFATILSPNLGELAIAVYFYIGVIAVMGITTSLGAKNHPLVILGALAFMVSDSIIAYNRFDAPIEGARYPIMITYYLAQYLLTVDARNNRYIQSWQSWGQST
jgi:uncharacterized membrane protein YhhN